MLYCNQKMMVATWQMTGLGKNGKLETLCGPHTACASLPLKAVTDHIHNSTEHTAAIHAHHSVSQRKIQHNHMKSVI